MAMNNGGGREGVDGMYNCGGSDGVKVRADCVVVWEDMIVDGEAKACCWYWK